MQKITTKMMVSMALLVALEVVLSRFLSINAWNIRVGFGFVPLVISAYMFGAIPTVIVAAVADIIGALLWPTGPYFVGFTITSALMGLVFGLFLYKKITAPRAVCAVAINQLILSLLLNTFWISFLYGSPYGPLFLTRIIKTAVLVPIQIIFIEVFKPVMDRVLKYGEANV